MMASFPFTRKRSVPYRMPRLMFAILIAVAAGVPSGGVLGAQTRAGQPAPDPDVRLEPRLIQEGQTVAMSGSGFTPNAHVLMHLVRPDGSEYPEMQFTTNASGEITHTIRIILIQTGTYELQAIDLTSKKVASSRFMVVEGTPPRLSSKREDQLAVLMHKGVWQGTIARAGQKESRPMLVSLSGGEVGAVVGTVAYPSLACGGELWNMGASGELHVLLGEHITYGEERCTSHGLVSIRPAADGGLEIERREAESPAAAPAMGVLPQRK